MTSSNDGSSTSSLAVVVDSEAFKCVICSKEFDDVPSLLNCGHSFCLPCIENMRKAAKERQDTKFECPTCSYVQIFWFDLIPNHAFRSFRDHIKSTKDFILQNPEYKALEKLVDHQKDQLQTYQNLVKEQNGTMVTTRDALKNGEKRISQLKDEIDSLKISLTTEENKASSLQDALDCEKKLSSSIQVDLNAAKEEVQKLNDNIVIEKNTAAESQKALKEEIQKLQTDVVFEKDRFAELQEVINCERDLNATICAKLEVLERENDTTKEEVRVLKEEVQKLRADLVLETSKSAEFQEAINRKEEQSATACAKLEVLERENEKLKLNIKNKEATFLGLIEMMQPELENIKKSESL